jgi:integrase/recombinase XerD
MATIYATVAAAKAALRRAAGDRDVLSAGLPPGHPAVVFALMFLEGLVSPATHRGYAMSLGQWFRWCVARGVEPFEATRIDARAYLASLQGRLRPGSQAANLGGIRSFYEEAEVEDYVVKNPFRRVRPKSPRRSQRRTPRLTAEQLAFALKKAAARIPTCPGLTGLRDYVLFYTGCRLGLRRAEYSALAKGSFRSIAGQLLVEVVGKEGTMIEVPVPDDVAELLDYWFERLSRAIGRALHDDDAVFPKLGGSDCLLPSGGTCPSLAALEPAGVAQAVKRVLTDGGLVGSRYSSHVLRATAATLASLSGANRFDIMELLRHADATMTDRYIDGISDVSAADYWRPDAPISPAEMRATFVVKRRRRSRAAAAGKAAA